MPGIEISDSVHWTNEQWEKYGNARITLSLPNYDALCEAVNLLTRGARLNIDQRSKWARRAEIIHEAILPQMPEFTQ